MAKPKNGSNNRKVERTTPAYVVVDERNTRIAFASPDPKKPWCITLNRRLVSRHASEDAAKTQVARLRRS